MTSNDRNGVLSRTRAAACMVAVAMMCAGFSIPATAGVHGPIAAWGWNDNGQCNVPAPNSGFVAGAGGVSHSLGLKSDGSIVVWGENSGGQYNVPTPNTGFVAIAAGEAHCLGLKSNGLIVAWGWNSYGQCNVPAPNTGFIAVEGGAAHSLGLKSDSSIVAWGLNDYGQCDVPAPNSGFIAVAGGGRHSLGLKPDGSIVAWGNNVYGQCNVPAPNGGFVAVACGVYHSLGVKSDGSIVAWGWNDLGQCNVPAPNSGFVAVAGGPYHSLGLKSDGSIVAWGYNLYGECNVPAPNSGFGAVVVCYHHNLAIRRDPVWRVPADVPTIRAGLNSAMAGDTVLVACGTYHENWIPFDSKSGVTLRSATGGADCVTIDADSIAKVIDCFDLTDCRVEGFTLTEGRYRWGGGMGIFYCPSLMVSNVVLYKNSVYDPAFSQGGGIDIEGCSPTLRNVTIVANEGSWGAGISLFDGALPRLENCIIAFNQGVSVADFGGCPQFTCSNIYGNSDGDWTGCFADQLGTNGNISANPLFCPVEWGQLRLDASSPCLPENNSCVQLMGALGEGCDVAAVPQPAGPAPRSFALAQNEPNPFSTVTRIQFALPRAERVRLAIYDLAGRAVAVLRDGDLPAGEHAAEWRGLDDAGRRVAPGAYLYRLEAREFRSARRLVFVR